MKSFFRLTLGLVFSSLAALVAGAFEGKVSLALQSGREAPQVINYAMKDGLIRMEPQIEEAGGAAMIMNLAKQEMTMIMPEQAMYMVMPLRGGPAGAKADATAPEQKVEKTGKTEDILGYKCEQFITTEDGQTTEMWITQELGTFGGLGASNPMGGMMGGGRGAKAQRANSWEQALKGMRGAFPLRVISRDAKGKETFRLEAKSVEPGKLPDSLFTPPAGFQKMSMPMMGGFGG